MATWYSYKNSTKTAIIITIVFAIILQWNGKTRCINQIISNLKSKEIKHIKSN